MFLCALIQEPLEYPSSSGALCASFNFHKHAGMEDTAAFFTGYEDSYHDLEGTRMTRAPVRIGQPPDEPLKLGAGIRRSIDKTCNHERIIKTRLSAWKPSLTSGASGLDVLFALYSHGYDPSYAVVTCHRLLQSSGSVFVSILRRMSASGASPGSLSEEYSSLPALAAAGFRAGGLRHQTALRRSSSGACHRVG